MIPKLWAVTGRYAAVAISIDKWEAALTLVLGVPTMPLDNLFSIAQHPSTNLGWIPMLPQLPWQDGNWNSVSSTQGF